MEDYSDRQMERALQENNAGDSPMLLNYFVDMKQGVITKIATTPANVPDAEGLKHVCPTEGMAFCDKAYCTQKAQHTLKSQGCHSGAILKNNMNGKNHDKDRWLTLVRMPYEGVFSFFKKRARYRGSTKVQPQGFLQAIAFNLKRWIKVEEALRNLSLATT